jgi:DNA-directed RNA polymerase I and III subunit RPAC1
VPNFLITFTLHSDDTEGTPQDTAVFSLQVKCVKNRDAPKDATLPEQLFIHRLVYTKDIVWEPIGNQTEIFRDNPIKPVDDDILIAKLSPGQELDLKMHCIKGLGKDHAKFSPVSTASYRLLPKIELLKEFEDEEADKLKQCFSDGVIQIAEKSDGKRTAKVVNSRLDSASRNVFRYPQFKDFVKMNLIKDHFICQYLHVLLNGYKYFILNVVNIESTGALSAHQLMIESMEILIGKCRHFLSEIEEHNKRIK